MPDNDKLNNLLSLLFQAHPWHGVSPGKDAPELVTAFIEIVPRDTVKYELDKASGKLRLDRPHRFSSLCPTPTALSRKPIAATASARCAASAWARKAYAATATP